MATHHITKPIPEVQVYAVALADGDSNELHEVPDDSPHALAFGRYHRNPEGLFDHVSDHRTRADAEAGINPIGI